MIRSAIKTIPGTVWLKRQLFGPLGPAGPAMQRAKDRGPHPEKKTIPAPPDFPERPRFVLYRIIGNDLEPRHRKGQARANLPFILENEPELTHCEKRFVVNRVVDPDEEAAIIDILEKAGYSYLHIPFNLEEYAEQPWDIQGIPAEYAPSTPCFARLRPDQQARIIARLNRHKNNYAIHNNGARNAALNEGRGIADWVLPWDGNCFLTESAWHDIRFSLQARPDTPYWLVPMARTRDNQELRGIKQHPPAREEPQVIFRRDSTLAFDEAFYYGRRPKVELFWRLGVPGKWDEWGIEPWDLPVPDFSDQAGAWEKAGWVARLSSGRSGLEVKRQQATAERARAQARAEATLGLLTKLDCHLIGQNLPLKPPLLSHSNPWDTPSRSDARSFDTFGSDHNPSKLAEHCHRIFETSVGASHTEPDTEAQQAKRQSLLDQADTLLNELLEMPPETTRSRLWQRLRHTESSDTPFVPELFHCLDAIRYLDSIGRLPPEKFKQLKDWCTRRLAWINQAFHKHREIQSLTRRISAYYLEATSLAVFIAAEEPLVELLRDAQTRLQVLTEEDTPAQHRVCLFQLAHHLGGPGMNKHFEQLRPTESELPHPYSP